MSLEKICIVTNAPVSQNPRVVKEADALSAAGYDVTVVFAQHATWTLPLDRTILQRGAWHARAVSICGGRVHRWLGRLLALRLRLFRALARFTLFFPVAELAYARFFVEQVVMAVRTRADLYIGHNPQSLPVVALAARIGRAGYAFDAEDLHSGQYPDAEADRLPHRILRHLERRYLPGCRYVSAASTGIAHELALRYGLPRPSVVYNTFAWAERAALHGDRCDRREGDDRISLYWYSQVVALDRGLQDAIGAVARLDGRVVLHIRGQADATTRTRLLATAGDRDVGKSVYFHEPVAPEELLARAAEHDVGLCLEHPVTLNRDVCVTNKLFLYLLAGLAVVATDTRGQREVLATCPEAGFLYAPADVGALTAILARLVADRDLLSRTKAAALRAAETRWNWEHEQVTLVETVRAVLPGVTGG